MRRWFAAAVLAGLALPAAPQDRQAQKEFEKEVKAAIADWKKAYSKAKSPADKAATIDQLKKKGKLILHDLIFKELVKVSGDSPEVARKIFDLLKGLDDPKAAETLDQVAGKNPDNAAIQRELADLKAAKTAVAEFRAAFAGNAEAKAAAFGKLKDAGGAMILHDLVAAELKRLVEGSLDDAKIVMDEIRGVDAPQTGVVLAAMIKAHDRDVDFMKAMVGLMTHVKWNSFYEALGGFIETRTFGEEGRAGMSLVTLSAAETGAKLGAIALTDGLIRTLKVMDDNISKDTGQGAKSEGSLAFRKRISQAVTGCSGMADLDDGEAFEDEWKTRKEKYLAKATAVQWCPATRKRWNRPYADKAAVCPHHEDKAEAEKEPKIPAFLTLQPEEGPKSGGPSGPETR